MMIEYCDRCGRDFETVQQWFDLAITPRRDRVISCMGDPLVAKVTLCEKCVVEITTGYKHQPKLQ